MAAPGGSGQAAQKKAPPLPVVPPPSFDDLCISVLVLHCSDLHPNERMKLLKFLFDLLQPPAPAAVAPSDLVAYLEGGIYKRIDRVPPFGAVLRAQLASLHSPDKFITAIDSLKILIGKPEVWDPNAFYLEPSSSLGTFVRRVVLSFQRASFSMIMALFRELQSLGLAKGGGGGAPAPAKAPEARLSGTQVEHHLNPLPGLIQRNTGREEGEVLSRFLHSPTQLPLVERSPKFHYLLSLEAVERGDMLAATEEMHRYFDMLALSSGGVDPNQHKHVLHVGYASFVLANILLRGGRIQDAIAAIHETIRLGQERGDHHLISISLSLLVSALDSSSSPSRVSSAALLKLQQQAAAGVASSGRISAAQAAVTGQTDRGPQNALTLASFLMQLPSLASPEVVLECINDATSRLYLGTALLRTPDIGELNAARLLLRSSLWQQYGNQTLSSLYPQMQLALQQQEPQPVFGSWHDLYNVPSTHEALMVHSRLALVEMEQGNYGNALRVLLEGFRQFPHFAKYHASWPLMAAVLLVTAELALNRRASSEAALLVDQLLAFSPPEDCMQPALYLSARLLYARVLLQRDSASEAAQVLEDAIDFAKERWPQRGDLQYLVTSFLLQLSDLHVRAGNFATALHCTLHVLAVCEQAQALDHLYTDATISLAEIMLHMGATGAKCRALVESVLPHALQHSALQVQAKAFRLLAQSLVAAPGADAKVFQDAFSLLDRALRIALRLEDVRLQAQIHYLRARFFHHLSMPAERNEAARLFRLASEQKEQPRLLSFFTNVQAVVSQLEALAATLPAPTV